MLLDYAVAAANSACRLLAALTLQVRCIVFDGLIVALVELDVHRPQLISYI